MQKKIAILFKFFWYKVFVLWKLKLLNFLMDIIVLTCGYHYYVISLGIFRARRSVTGLRQVVAKGFEHSSGSFFCGSLDKSCKLKKF